MFKNLFSKNEYSSQTGFFEIIDNNIIPIDELQLGSINDCIETIGYPTNHIYVVHVFDDLKISALGFIPFTKEVKFVLAKNHDIKLNINDVKNVIKSIDWEFEYSILNVEEMLQEGIDNENLSIDFLKPLLNLIKEEETLYKNEKYGLYLHFENNILKAFTSSEWDNSSTKWLNDINPNMVSNMIREAKIYQENEMDVMSEVNNQADSLMKIPNVLQNEFIQFHINDKGNINFYNLLITHYINDCNLNDFLFMNKDRYNKIAEIKYEVGMYVYEFDSNDLLINVFEK
ncbi:hypothetical protein [Empedobacter sp.]|uniref:hypothetical protein n=1 Tax=Empedobacter sp. TaxID=1927715 RepID=UPI0028998D48|nr:hypothetical protein [Empedobacter sp.]